MKIKMKNKKSADMAMMIINGIILVIMMGIIMIPLYSFQNQMILGTASEASTLFQMVGILLIFAFVAIVEENFFVNDKGEKFVIRPVITIDGYIVFFGYVLSGKDRVGNKKYFSA